jgi:hypothetical protein
MHLKSSLEAHEPNADVPRRIPHRALQKNRADLRGEWEEKELQTRLEYLAVKIQVCKADMLMLKYT